MSSLNCKHISEEEYNSNENMDVTSSGRTLDASSRFRDNDDESMFRSPTLSMSLRHRKRKLDYSGADFDDDISSTKSRRRTKSSKVEDDDYTPRKPRKNRMRSAANTIVGSVYQSTAVTRRSAPRDTNCSGLFTVVRASKDLDLAAEKWVAGYEVDQNDAVLQILQLFVDACGCSGILNKKVFEISSYKEVTDDLSGEFDEDAGEYPLGVNSPQWKKFRSNFAKFLLLFVFKCRRQIIYETFLMNHVLKLLTAFSESRVRAFRHTSTFAAMKLSSAISSIIPDVVASKEKIAIQIEAEKIKLNNVDRSSDRLELLVTTKSDLELKIEDLKMMVEYIFKTILIDRYRDVVVDIRCICIEELCNCMHIYPTAFLDDAYLKYVGWCLNDKNANVRFKCVAGLLMLYNHDEMIGRLELFTNTFVDRLTSLVNDHVPEVAIKACHILTQIYCTFPDVLEKKHCEPIYELVFSTNRNVALAVGRFLNAKVLQEDQSNSSSMQINTNEDGQLLQNLVQFYQEVNVHQKSVSFLVDALIDLNPLMKNWSAMIEMVLQEKVENAQTGKADVLVELMACAVKEVATGEAPPGRTVIPKRTVSSLAQSTRVMKEEKRCISEAFIPRIPELIDRFINDPKKLVCLTTIPMHFQLELYFASSRKLNVHLDILMQKLARIVQQHEEEALLQNVAKVISLFSKQNASVASQTEDVRNEIINGLAVNVKQAMQRFDSRSDDEVEGKDDISERDLLAAYTKIVAFSACVDIDRCGLWDVTLKMTNNEAGVFDCAELIEKGLVLLFRQIAWQFERITESENVDDDEILDLVMKRDQFLACTKSILESSLLGVESAFLCLCDALIIFNFAIAAEVPADDLMRSLPIKLNDNFTARVTDFLVENVFAPIESESFVALDVADQIQLMEKRRNYLGSYCKLITYGALPVIDASLVLRYYNKFSHQFDDLLKALLQKCRELDKVASAKAIILSLISAYNEIKAFSGDGIVDVLSSEFAELRELSKRFSLSFGPDLVRNREAIVMIHKDGISFALNVEEQRRLRNKDNRPSDLSFLEALIDFASRLVSQDKVVVLRYLEKHCPARPEPSFDDDTCDLFWEPYLNYKKALTTNKKA